VSLNRAQLDLFVKTAEITIISSMAGQIFRIGTMRYAEGM